MISYAGIKLNAPNRWIESEIESKISLRHVQDTVRRWQPSFAESHWDHSGYPHSMPISLNTLRWPVSASSWAMFHGIVSGSRLQQIRNAVGSTGNLPAKTLVIDDGTYKIETDMYALPPRPLFKTQASSVYLLTLVDARYWWQHQGLDITFNEGSTSWASLYALIAAALSISMTADSVASTYGYPSRDLISLQYSAGRMLDAAAGSVGQRIIRNLDGTVKAQGHASAAASVDGNLSFKARAGGEFERFDFGGGVPGTFRTVFPVSEAGVFQNEQVYAVDVPLADLDLEGQAIAAPGVKTFRSTALAYGSTPTNLADLEDLAEQIAADYYGWEAEGSDVVIRGVFPWTIEGQHNVSWTLRHDRAETRITRAILHAERGAHYLSAGSLSESFGGDSVSRTQTNHGWLVAVPQNLAVSANSTSLALPGAESVRLTPSGAWVIHGFANGIGGKRHRLWNVGGASLTLMHQSGSAASATDRIICSTGGDITLAPNESAETEYDLTTGRWRVSIAVASNTTVDITTVENLTVTNSFTSENEAQFNANVTIGSGFALTIYSPVNFYTATSYFNANSTINFNGTTNFNSNFSIGANLTLAVGINNIRNYAGNATYNFVGIFTICGNTTICENKTLTLPRIIGNDTSGKLRITSNATANATLPTALRVDNSTLEMTMVSSPPTPANGTRGMYFDANGSLMGIDSNGTTYSLTNTGNGTSNGSTGLVQYADGSGGFSATADITIDATNGTLYAETLRAGITGGYHILYADANGTVSAVSPQIVEGRVLFTDANGLPIDSADLTFNSTSGTLYAETLKLSPNGGGDVLTYLDNNGTLQVLANPGTGNFTLHCVNGTLGWF